MPQISLLGDFLLLLQAPVRDIYTERKLKDYSTLPNKSLLIFKRQFAFLVLFPTHS